MILSFLILSQTYQVDLDANSQPLTNPFVVIQKLNTASECGFSKLDKPRDKCQGQIKWPAHTVETMIQHFGRLQRRVHK